MHCRIHPSSRPPCCVLLRAAAVSMPSEIGLACAIPAKLPRWRLFPLDVPDKVRPVTQSSTLFRPRSYKEHQTRSSRRPSTATSPLIAMMQSQSASRALQCLPRARRALSTSSRLAALSPYNRSTAATQNQTTTAKRNVSAKASMQAQAAAAPSQTAQRTVPSPAFNREDAKLRDVQPLQPYRQPELDHSFVGMKGGEIFHDMMLRHGVKHVCKWRFPSGVFASLRGILTQNSSRLPRWCDSPRFRCDLQQQRLRLHPPQTRAGCGSHG